MSSSRCDTCPVTASVECLRTCRFRVTSERDRNNLIRRAAQGSPGTRILWPAALDRAGLSVLPTLGADGPEVVAALGVARTGRH